MIETLNSRRLRLVPVQREHAAQLYPVLADPVLYKYTGGAPPAAERDVARWFAQLETRQSPDGAQRWLTWVVTLVRPTTCIGYVQATIEGQHADIAWLIGTDWQNKGYAREAAATLLDWLRTSGTTRVSASIHPRHVASQHIAVAIGMRRSGREDDGEEVWETA